MKVILIGMNNPLSMKPQHALYPHPPGCAGNNLWKKMADVYEGFDRNDYINVFERINLVRGEWSHQAAVAKAAHLYRHDRFDERIVVLLGSQVEWAFKVAGVDLTDDDYFAWRTPGPSRFGKWTGIPHPSGRSRVWNDLEIRSQSKQFFSELVPMAVKAAQEK